MTKALFVPTTGEVRVVELPTENTYETLRDLVGGLLTTVRMPDELNEVTMYVDDEGLLYSEPLPVNVVASALALQVLVGNAVIVGNRSPEGEYDGDDYDVPSWMLTPQSLEYLNFIQSDDVRRQRFEEHRPEPTFEIIPLNLDDPF